MGFSTVTAGGPGLLPGQGTKILQAVQQETHVSSPDFPWARSDSDRSFAAESGKPGMLQYMGSQRVGHD